MDFLNSFTPLLVALAGVAIPYFFLSPTSGLPQRVVGYSAGLVVGIAIVVLATLAIESSPGWEPIKTRTLAGMPVAFIAPALGLWARRRKS